ncbi:hypothetical protein ACVWZZ_000383 [Bradyrhizobium sp. LM6.10]
MVWLIALMRQPIPQSQAACWVASCMLAIWFDISSVALAVWPASVLTSWATTAKTGPPPQKRGRHRARGFDGGIQRQEVGLTELGWREFCRHLLHDHPNLATENLQANFDGG